MTLSSLGLTPSAKPAKADKEIYKQYTKVVDALSRNSVTSSSQLAALYQFDDEDIDNNLLRNLTGIAEPSVRVRLTMEDGTLYPPKDSKAEDGYELYLTYNALMFAPRVRIECIFVKQSGGRSKPYHKMALEFHFQPCNGTQLKQFEKRGNIISFTVEGATISGFSSIVQRQDRLDLGQSERDIINLFGDLTSSTPARKLSFKLAENGLSASYSKALAQIYERLPGGSGVELPSFSNHEYDAFGNDGHYMTMTADTIPKPYDLMNGTVPSPMTPLNCGNTLTSLAEAKAQFAQSVTIADVESRTSLELWAAKTHHCKLFSVEGFPVIAVKFCPFRKLGGVNDEVKYRLPRELFVKMKLPARGAASENFEGYLESDALDLPAHQAFFVVTSRSLRWFEKELQWKPGQDSYKLVQFEPHYNSFTYGSQLQTINLLQHSTYWRPHLLNQRCDSLKVCDMTAGLGIDPAKIAEADKWLLKCRKWNSEQLRVIKKIHAAKGRMVLTMGIAGTGKTLLQSAIATYFAKLGFKCLICTPANSNADHSAKLLRAFTKKDDPKKDDKPGTDKKGDEFHDAHEVQTDRADDHANSAYFTASSHQDTAKDEDDIRVHRLYPSSRNVGLKNLSQDQAKHRRVGHTNRAVSSIHGLEFKLRNRKAGVRDLGIEQGVIDEAERGVLHYKKCLKKGGPPIDVWDKFREHLAASREDRLDEDDFQEYSKCYEACKGHLVALTNIMVTTTGNARCSELVDHWIQSNSDYDIPYKGVIVLCDEAAKDPEINTWMPIIMPGERTKGVFMFGDEKQLAPTNTYSRGKLNFNIYNDRLNLPLPLRLINEGFPHTSLKEQQRMHPCISKFPNEEFYNGKLRDGPRVKAKLDDVQPGLTKVLHGIIAKSFTSKEESDAYLSAASDEQARHHYLEISGNVDTNEESGSKFVKAHLEVFFNHVFPDLQTYFKEKTKENLMIICGYGYAIGEYQRGFLKLQKEQMLSDAHYPEVVAQQAHDGLKDLKLEDCTDSKKDGDKTKKDGDKAKKDEKKEKPIDKALLDPRVLTIDSAQGQESLMVIMDGSFQYRDKMGFMTDRGRYNVAMTRAKGVFWILGGALDCADRRNTDEALSPFPKLKKEMEGLGRVHKFKV